MKLVLIFSFISFQIFCCEINSLTNDIIENTSEFSTIFAAPIQNQICENFEGLTTNTELNKEINNLVQNQTNKIWNIKNRHKMGEALNQCDPERNSNALVITFAGTGSYNPRAHSLMAKLIKCEKFQSLPTWMKKAAYGKLLSSLKKKGSAYTKWSCVEKGPLSSFIENESLNNFAKDFDFAAFASEESELIADINNIKNYGIKELSEEVFKSVSGFPTGIFNALGCTISYFKKAQELGIEPKLIVMSHSSGGRASVKYLENLKLFLPNKKADLVLSIDPVKEAQHAIQEVASQYAGKVANELLDYIPFVDKDEKKAKTPINVWTRRQPESLYKTSNSNRWINFYENVDTHGLELGFGIRGSPIHNADSNQFITGLGSKAHGEICYDKKVKDKIEEEVLKLFDN